MQEWAIIGSLVGIVMGLTGAGGGLVSVPLFVHLVGADVYDATTFALFMVITGSSLNWFLQRDLTIKPIAYLLVVCGFFGSFLFNQIKLGAPSWAIRALFITVCLAGLLMIWLYRRPPMPSEKSGFSLKWTPKTTLKYMATGFGMGGISTLTGLGGGAVLMPWLIGPMRMPVDRAVPTSLYAIALNATASLWIQRARWMPVIEWQNVVALVIGTLIAATGVRFALTRIHVRHMNVVRKAMLTTVILLAVVMLAIGGGR